MSTALEVARSIVNGLPDAAILLDRTQTMVAYNALFAGITGLRGSDGVGIAIEPFNLLGIDPEADQARAKECLEKRTVIRLAEVETKTETGATFTMQVTFLPVLDKPERAAFVIVVFRDVTDDAALQSRYREMVAEEKRISEQLRERIEQMKRELGQL